MSQFSYIHYYMVIRKRIPPIRGRSYQNLSWYNKKLCFRTNLLGVSTRIFSRNWVRIFFHYFLIFIIIWLLEKGFYQIRGRLYQNRSWYNKKLGFHINLLGVSTRFFFKNWVRLFFHYFLIFIILWLISKMILPNSGQIIQELELI